MAKAAKAAKDPVFFKKGKAKSPKGGGAPRKKIGGKIHIWRKGYKLKRKGKKDKSIRGQWIPLGKRK